MPAAYKVNPYIQIIESRLIPGSVHFAAFNRLTGRMLPVTQSARKLLLERPAISLSAQDLISPPADKAELVNLISAEFVIPVGADPLMPFQNWTVVRPIQNPAIVYTLTGSAPVVVRPSMSQYVFSPEQDDVSSIIEEILPASAARIFMLADATRTLHEVFEEVKSSLDEQLRDPEFQEALDFLTHAERQLIKFAPPEAPLMDPFQPFNAVPRNLYLGRSHMPAPTSAESSVEFHRQIENAAHEFDRVEPTVNHAFRFPSQALGALDYGGRFYTLTMKSEVLPLLSATTKIRVLEVGGGTGTFAKGFLDQAKARAQTGLPKVDYRILELSPALAKSQRDILARAGHNVSHYCQDATIFDIPDQKFELIIANEVAADFPVASTTVDKRDKDRRSWTGDAAADVEKYELRDESAPDSFLVNVGAMRFIERCWEHLVPGGTLILTEYGNDSQFPARAFHLNHAEFSIHFGHLKKCAEIIGFDCRLLSMMEFLDFDGQVSMLAGHEEHIMCLNKVFERVGACMSYHAYSEAEFQEEFGEVVKRTKLTGVSFLPLRNGFHYGPRVQDFHVLIMNKPND